MIKLKKKMKLLQVFFIISLQRYQNKISQIPEVFKKYAFPLDLFSPPQDASGLTWGVEIQTFTPKKNGQTNKVTMEKKKQPWMKMYPLKINMSPKQETISKGNLIFQPLIFKGYLSFPGEYLLLNKTGDFPAKPSHLRFQLVPTSPPFRESLHTSPTTSLDGSRWNQRKM